MLAFLKQIPQTLDLTVARCIAHQAGFTIATPHEHDDEDVVQITSRVDSAFRRLVAADILMNWSPHIALSALPNPDVCGSDKASDLCNSFCKDISSRHTFESKLRLLRNLACDLVHLRTDACQSLLDLETPVHELLLVEN